MKKDKIIDIVNQDKIVLESKKIFKDNKITYNHQISTPQIKTNDKITQFIPDIDDNYIFDDETLSIILLALEHNKRLLIQGLHGTGKSTHIEQVAARLNWPVIRINLDGYITRSDLVGKDVIEIRDGKQVTAFDEGLLIKAIKNPVILIFDEYDAAKSDVMFVIQRLLEQNGKFTLLENNEIIEPHPYFRLFATTNTLGFGDDIGIYHGVNPINQGQMDRFDMLHIIDYLTLEKELAIIIKKFPQYDNKEGIALITQFIQMANLIRKSFNNEQISTIISLRTLINWVDNFSLLNSIDSAFKLSFYNKCTGEDKEIIKEYYQRIFAKDLA